MPSAGEFDRVKAMPTADPALIDARGRRDDSNPTSRPPPAKENCGQIVES
jgi:hypothetical protein